MKRAILCHLSLVACMLLLAGCGSERGSGAGGVAQHEEIAGNGVSASEGDGAVEGEDYSDSAFESPSPDELGGLTRKSAGAAGSGVAPHRYFGAGADPAAATSASAPPPRGPAGGKTADSRFAHEPPRVATGTTEPVAPDAGRLDPAPPPKPAVDKPAPPKRNDIQSGLLTAGSFDDHAHFDAYQKYLSKAMQQDSRETFPRYALGERVEIQVVDPQGRPVGGARVVVRPADRENKELLSTITGSDGRAVFCTALDNGADQAAFSVAVTPPGGNQETVETLKVAERPWRVTLAGRQAKLPRQLDLALVIDTTGSMGDELEYLKVEIDSIVETVSRMFPDVDQRYALVVYRDQGDEYVSRTFDFTSSLNEFRGNLAAQHANGGGDYPEAVQVAVEHAGKLSWREGNAARVMFLVGDAPPHDEYLGAALDATQVLRGRGVRIFPVGGSGVAQKAQFVFRAMSFLTMGQYLFLTDHSGVGNPHATPDVPEFQVERLDRLMIRMISSELAGKRLAPQEVIAIERGDLDPSQPPIVEQNGPPGQVPPGQVPPGQIQPEPEQPQVPPAAVPEAVAEPQASARFSLPAAASSPIAWIALAAVVCAAFVGDAIRDRVRAE